MPCLEFLANRAFEVILEERVVVQPRVTGREGISRIEVPGAVLRKVEAPFDMRAHIHRRAAGKNKGSKPCESQSSEASHVSPPLSTPVAKAVPSVRRGDRS